MMNLDLVCMKAAQAMVAGSGDKADKENLATKALGVLLENGPYGMMLFLKIQKKEMAPGYRKQLLAVLRDAAVTPPPPDDADFQKETAWLRGAAANLDTYLFIKRLWQQTLTYARYHAKAAD